MPTNTADGFVVNIKVESTEGTAATGGAATGERLRVLPSSGLNLMRGTIQSAEIRNDANAGKVRLGAKRVDGSYAFELSQGSFDTVIEAALRSTWVAATAVTFNNGAALTSLTVDSSSQVTFAGTTTPVAAGLRVGDVFRLTNMSTSANNDVNCRVKTISGSVVTLHGTPLTTQAADTACTLTIHKKLAQATTPTRRTFTIEQYYEDVDESEYFVGCRLASMGLSLTPNGHVTGTFGFLGMGRTTLASGASPYFTSPTEYTSIGLVATDATLVYNGTAIATLTAMSLTHDIATDAPEVVGSTTIPGTYDNRSTTSGTMSGLLTGLSGNNTLFDAETEFEVHIHLVEPESEPKSHFTIYLPAVKLTGVEKGLGGDGPMLENLAFTANPRVAATGYDAGVMTISTAS